MGSLNSTHPGAHEEIYKKGISVCRYNTGIRQSIDGTEEQTFTRHAILTCSGETFSEEAFFACNS